MSKSIEFTVAIDTREQRPYFFKNSVVKTLRSGDYSVVGLEDAVAVERKTKPDAYGSLGQGRDRFEREFARLALMDYAAVVIESSMEDFIKAPAYSKLNPKSAINSLIAWAVRYKVGLFFAGNRRMGMTVTYRILEKFAKDWQDRESHKNKRRQGA